MIELPSFAVASNFTGTLMDAGFNQRGIQSVDYIPRKGSRYKVGLSFGPYTPDQGRIMVSRLIAAKQGGGLRVKLPVLHAQGNAGTPSVSSASGRTLTIGGLPPGYVIGEGFWLSIVKNGQHYLHSVGIGATATGGGTATIELNELLRTDFVAGAAIHLTEPQVEGIIEGDEWSWNYSVDRVIPIEFVIEEKA